MTSIQLVSDTGNLIRYPDFPATGILPRHVDVWCPPGYADSTTRYPVLYMHDGQNIFDPTTSLTTGIDWGVDEAMVRLMQEANLPGAIIVGVWNSPQRVRDYMPQKPVELAGESVMSQFVKGMGGPPASDAYLQFLVQQLKPFIDATYRTLPDQPYTFVMGSSMGGLISLYALTEYPHIFGGAGCVSTHWPIGKEPLVAYFSQVLPRPGHHKLYFDYGTTGLDAEYEPFQQQLDEALQTMGYEQGKNWLTQKFEGHDHTERDWRARVHLPLQFWLGNAVIFNL